MSGDDKKAILDAFEDKMSVVLEAVDDTVAVVIEELKSMKQTMASKEDIEDVKDEIGTIKLAIRDTNKDIIKQDKRISGLEQQTV